MSASTGSKDPFIASLGKIYAGYTGGFAVFVVLLAGLFLGEGLGPARLLGAGLVVAGALLIAR